MNINLEDLSNEELDELMKSFVSSAAEGCLDQNGWITDSYNGKCFWNSYYSPPLEPSFCPGIWLIQSLIV